MSERGQPRLWITFDDARLLYAGLSEDKYHAWCFGKTGGVLMNSLVRAGLGFCLRWIWESYRLRVKSGWRCSAGVWVRCFAVAGCGVVGREGCSAIGLVSVWLFVSLVSCVVSSPVFPSPGCGASLCSPSSRCARCRFAQLPWCTIRPGVASQEAGHL